VLDQHTTGYLTHGITLHDNAVVFDVGANVGVFAVRAVQRHPGTRVFAFEPIPPIREALEANAALHGDGRIQPMPFGVGEDEGEFSFTYYPRSPALSTSDPGVWDDDPGALTEAVRGSIQEARHEFWYAHLVPLAAAGLVAGYLRGKSSTHRCQVRPLSQVIADNDVAHIDLLKVDCEGAELATLLSVAEDQWPRIQQVVAEVHDRDGRLDTVTRLLAAKGFDRIEVVAEPGFEATPLRNVHASRTGP
jgi:FkbM family methyltransferase